MNVYNTSKTKFLVKFGFKITRTKIINGIRMYKDLITLGIGYLGELVIFDFFKLEQIEYPKKSITEKEFFIEIVKLARDILESIDEGYLIINKTITEYDN